ncbi:glucosamine-6-phosphate deaminase [Gracilibacillus sp. HCP3S3_G5_1]|uniref:glucosamine-6-phosphate deaminase n=1 Tax=unclassified Gracilibacillus TaxID=2625209 RepID=UPI003F898171
MKKLTKDNLIYYVCANRHSMGQLAAKLAGDRIKQLLLVKEEVRVIFAAAPSQNEFLSYLTGDKDIDWSRVVGLHMDEYLGLAPNSDQWFSKYLQRNITNRVQMKDFHFINGLAAPEEEIDRYTNLIKEAPIDLVCLGIGENGHIAFNDPPVADFQDPTVMKIVELDHYCRQQQVNDGCFENLEDVPTHALTLTIPALMSGKSMICTVPGDSKKDAIHNVLNKEISTMCPASILRTHKDSHLIVDREAYGSL